MDKSHLIKLALKESVKITKSVFKNMDVFQEFSAYEDMGKMDCDMLMPIDFELTENEVVEDELDPMDDALDVLFAPDMTVYLEYIIFNVDQHGMLLLKQEEHHQV